MRGMKQVNQDTKHRWEIPRAKWQEEGLTWERDGGRLPKKAVFETGPGGVSGCLHLGTA